jgi:hypothetical protein
MDQPSFSPDRPRRSPLTVCLGRMPKMLSEILGRMLSRRSTFRVIVDEADQWDPTAVLRHYHPDALLLGRPDCDYIELETLVRASPATRIVQFSPDGRTAVVYETNALPLTIERPSIEDLVEIVTASGSVVDH